MPPLLRILVAVVLASLLSVMVPVGVAPGGEKEDAPPQRPPPRAGPHVAGVDSSAYDDRDRNRVYDTLDAKVKRARPEERIPVVVVFDAPVSDEDLEEMRARHGDFPVHGRWSAADAVAVSLVPGQIRAFAARDDVRHVEEERTYSVSMTSASKWFGTTKARTDFGFDGDLTGALKTYAKDDVVVCVVDTGIHAGHLDLDEGQVIGWADFVGGLGAPYDDNGHGTHVAGIAVGQGDANPTLRGVAPGAALVGVKVLDASGIGTTADVLDGIQFCIDNKVLYGIEIVSMSLGESGSSDGEDAVSLAVEAAWDAGLVVVVAAGNEGPDVYTIGSPGAAPSVITVGSMADPGPGTVLGFSLAPYSSRGPTADDRVKPDVVAPGSSVKAPKTGTASGYVTSDGTSMATPFVAGVAALLLDADPTMTNGEVKTLLTTTAQNWRNAGPDNDYGAGRVRPYEAVRSACGCAGTPPGTPNHYYKRETFDAEGGTDVYDLSVTSNAHPIAATLLVPGLGKDFDLYLYDPSDVLVEVSEGTLRQENLGYKPTVTGTWTVVVESFEGTGMYYLDLSYKGTAPTLVEDG